MSEDQTAQTFSDENAQDALGGERGEVTEPRELTIDDIYDDHNDIEAIKAAERAMALPGGSYTTDPDGTKLFVKQDKTGRPYAMITTKLFKVDEAGKETRGSINYFLSWVPRNSHVWEDEVDTGADSGKPDAKTKLFIQARKAYLKAFGESAVINEETGFPPNQEVVRYLHEFSHKVFVVAREGQDSRVASISAVASA